MKIFARTAEKSQKLPKKKGTLHQTLALRAPVITLQFINAKKSRRTAYLNS